MQYTPALDGLRALAVLAVMAFHCKLPFALGGFNGVEVFFVLSGFLITSILRQELGVSGRINLIHFYYRRAVRLFPPLIFFLAGYAAIGNIFFGESDQFIDILITILYLSDYGHAFWQVPSGIGHTWSLAVEQHFYLIWPFFLLVLRPVPINRAISILLLVFVLATIWRIIDLTIFHNWRQTYFRFDTRLSGLILGSALAMVRFSYSRITLDCLGFFGLSMILMGFAFGRFDDYQSLTLGVLQVDFGTAAIIVALASESHFSRMFSWLPAVKLGRISYAVYLWSVPISLVCRQNFDPYLAFTATAAISIPLSIISWIYVERPLMVSSRKNKTVSKSM